MGLLGLIIMAVSVIGMFVAAGYEFLRDEKKSAH